MLEAGFDATALAEEEPKPIVKVFPVGKTKTNCIIVGCEKVGRRAAADGIFAERVPRSLLCFAVLNDVHVCLFVRTRLSSSGRRRTRRRRRRLNLPFVHESVTTATLRATHTVGVTPHGYQ